MMNRKTFLFNYAKMSDDYRRSFWDGVLVLSNLMAWFIFIAVIAIIFNSMALYIAGGIIMAQLAAWLAILGRECHQTLLSKPPVFACKIKK